MTWPVTVVTLFPEMFPGALGYSVVGKAMGKGLLDLSTVNIRDYALNDQHKTVDDTPYGGGAGMVMRADVVDRAICAAEKTVPDGSRLLYMSPRGKPFTQALAKEFAMAPGLVILCGRYEGIDQRVIEHRGLEEVSIGDYILTGGEIPAMVVIETSFRLKKGVLGKEDSLKNESFELQLLENSHFTRPREWKGMEVPGVLLSGNHAEIEKWRRDDAEKITKLRRPDLWEKYVNLSKVKRN